MHLGWDCLFTLVSLAVCVAAPPTPDEDHAVWKSPAPNDTAFAREAGPTGPWVPPQRTATRGARYEPTIWRRGIYESTQVNVDNYGQNIPDDAANEPSLAVDPTDSNKMVIGWRQFDDVASGARQAGWGYSQNAGQAWMFGGTLAMGTFGSDPVVRPDSLGVFYYLSLGTHELRLFRSYDRGASWLGPNQVTPYSIDKPWMAIDRTQCATNGFIYVIAADSRLYRSIDGGDSFQDEGPTTLPEGFNGTMTVGPDGTLYAVDYAFFVYRSNFVKSVALLDIAGWDVDSTHIQTGVQDPSNPNPGGLLGQNWVATDHSFGPTRGNVYILGSKIQYPYTPPNRRVLFARSCDWGRFFSPLSQLDPTPGWQWFGMMDVAPNGRIDALWNDTRNTGVVNLSELHYSFSLDGGETWSPAVAVSPVFDSWVGWPGGNNKLGDYYDLTSDARGVNVAYAATFNGEQDIYFLRIEQNCNFNDVPDHVEIAKGYAADCNDNLIPDECETFGDCTCDWIVTLADHAALVDCMTGPALPPYQGGTEGGSPTRTDDGTALHQHRDSHGAVNAWEDRASARVALEDRPNDRLENRSHTGARSPRLAAHNFLPPACQCADSHRDGAIDLADFARLQRFLTAP